MHYLTINALFDHKTTAFRAACVRVLEARQVRLLSGQKEMHYLTMVVKKNALFDHNTFAFRTARARQIACLP